MAIHEAKLGKCGLPSPDTRTAVCDCCEAVFAELDPAYCFGVETRHSEWVCGECVPEILDAYFAEQLKQTEWHFRRARP